MTAQAAAPAAAPSVGSEDAGEDMDEFVSQTQQIGSDDELLSIASQSIPSQPLSSSQDGAACHVLVPDSQLWQDENPHTTPQGRRRSTARRTPHSCRGRSPPPNPGFQTVTFCVLPGMRSISVRTSATTYGRRRRNLQPVEKLSTDSSLQYLQRPFPRVSRAAHAHG